MSESISLAEALPQQQQRVRELMEQYREAGRLIGQPDIVKPAIIMMEFASRAADKAASERDTVAMLTAYYDLKEFSA